MSNSQTTFPQQVQAKLGGFEGISPGARILVGVSGGADSMALLTVLRELGYAVEAAHVDHGTRAGASADDAAFVREHCAGNGIPVHAIAVDVPALAADSPLSFEETARDVRYRFFIDTAREHACDAAAAAHLADDQAETVLMRVLRGTSPRGLSGIPPVSQRDGVRIIRPLIDVTREEILAYLDERCIPFREDETNLDPGFLRNRIRHELLPQLKREFNPNIRDALVRLAAIHRDEDDLLRASAEALLALCAPDDAPIQRKAFATAHRALQRRALLQLAWARGAFPEFERVDAAVDFVLNAPSNKRFDLGGGVQLVSAPGTVSIESQPREPLDTREVALPVPGETEAFGRRFQFREMEAPPSEPLSHYCTHSRQVFDADRFGGPLTLRHRREGDRLAPLGMEGTRKLKDYFRDIGVPPEKRDRVVLLTREGEVLWVVGGAVSRNVAVTQGTRRYAEITVAE